MNKNPDTSCFSKTGVSRNVMRELDRKAIEDYGIPGILLMENAGRNVAEEAVKILRKGTNKKAAVICGKGNNGGDGFVVARHIHNMGYEVKVFLTAEVDKIIGNGDAGLNLKILGSMNIKVNEVINTDGVNNMTATISDCALVVDAIFGTGLKGTLREPAKSIIEKINDLNKVVISVDIPSGLDCDKGKVLGACIKANKTVTFALPKKGFFIEDGPDYVGELVVSDISIPRELLTGVRSQKPEFRSQNSE